MTTPALGPCTRDTLLALLPDERPLEWLQHHTAGQNGAPVCPVGLLIERETTDYVLQREAEARDYHLPPQPWEPAWLLEGFRIVQLARRDNQVRRNRAIHTVNDAGKLPPREAAALIRARMRGN